MSKRYLGLFLAVLAIEFFIALVVHDRVVRPFVGDVLVVILIYCVWLAERRQNRTPSSTGSG